jgi:hypothetical protein
MFMADARTCCLKTGPLSATESRRESRLREVSHHFVEMMPKQTVDIIPTLRHHVSMRTTLTLDDDILELATRQAKLRGVSLGKTVSDLVRRGLSASTPAQDKGGLVVFRLPADSPKVTSEDVRRIEAEGA